MAHTSNRAENMKKLWQDPGFKEKVQAAREKSRHLSPEERAARREEKRIRAQERELRRQERAAMLQARAERRAAREARRARVNKPLPGGPRFDPEGIPSFKQLRTYRETVLTASGKIIRKGIFENWDEPLQDYR